MPDRLREIIAVGRVAAMKTTVAVSLWLMFFFLLSCGGSGTGDDGDGSETIIFPPVVFMADKDTNGTVELYASFDDGTNVIKLSDTMGFGGNVVDFKVSPDGLWVAYVADQDTNAVFELYVVPVDKASDEDAVKVSGVPMDGDGIKEKADGSYAFEWAPDSSRVAYLADQDADGVIELYSNTPDGSDNVQVSGTLVNGGDVQDFQWEPKSSLIAYVANQDTVGKFELYVSPADGNNPNPTVSELMAGIGIKEDPAGSGEYAFAWAPDSSRISYIADQDVINQFELYTSTPDGIDNLLISGPFGIGLGQDVEEFAWAPDSQRIAYTANQDNVNAIDLYSAPPNVTASSQKNSTGLFAGQAVSAFKWAPDSSRIAFISDKGVTGFFRLYTVQPVNFNNIFVSGSIQQPSDVTEFEWSPDSSTIAYLVVAPSVELYTTLPTSGASTQIGDLPQFFDGDVLEFEWAPDSSRIAYTADYEIAGVIELFTSTPDNDDTQQVSDTLVSGGDVGVFNWAPDSSGVGYIADQDTNNVDELFASRPNGNDNTNLSGRLVNGGEVASFAWVP